MKVEKIIEWKRFHQCYLVRPKKVEEVKTDWCQDLQSRAIENVMERQRILGRFSEQFKDNSLKKKNRDKVWEAFKKVWIIQPRKNESDWVHTLPIERLAGSVDVNLLLLCENDNHGKIIPAQQTRMTVLGSCPCFLMGWLCCWDILRLWAVKCMFSAEFTSTPTSQASLFSAISPQ